MKKPLALGRKGLKRTEGETAIFHLIRFPHRHYPCQSAHRAWKYGTRPKRAEESLPRGISRRARCLNGRCLYYSCLIRYGAHPWSITRTLIALLLLLLPIVLPQIAVAAVIVVLAMIIGMLMRARATVMGTA